MNSTISLLVSLAIIMWQLIDWMKLNWESVSFARELTIGVALVLSIGLTLTFSLDLFVALSLATEPTIVGGVFAALALTAGSGFINEVVKKINPKA